MRRQLTVVAAALTTAITLAACSSGGGVHPQSLSPAPSGSSPSSSREPAISNSLSTAEHPDPTISPSRTPKDVPTPSVTPPAQKAVDAYAATKNVLVAWDSNPHLARSTELSPYVTSIVLKQVLNQYRLMAESGLAYRGTPDLSHITVIEANTSSAIFTDCATPSSNDPYTQYVVRTGKPVASTVPAGLHPKAVTVILQAGRWRVSGIVPNLAKTCSP